MVVDTTQMVGKETGAESWLVSGAPWGGNWLCLYETIPRLQSKLRSKAWDTEKWEHRIQLLDAERKEGQRRKGGRAGRQKGGVKGRKEDRAKKRMK